MEKYAEVVQLGLPYLTPKDMCKLRCTCSGFRDMRVSWHEHDIEFLMDGSCSAISWLHKNIVAMRKLDLVISTNLPEKCLQDLMEAGR
jgi:hypothetical protein